MTNGAKYVGVGDVARRCCDGNVAQNGVGREVDLSRCQLKREISSDQYIQLCITTAHVWGKNLPPCSETALLPCQ